MDDLRQRLINAMPTLRHSAGSTVLDDILAELDAAGYAIVPKEMPDAVGEILENRIPYSVETLPEIWLELLAAAGKVKE